MYTEIFKFWFDEIEPAQWWMKDVDFDRMLIVRFSISGADHDSSRMLETRKPRERITTKKGFAVLSIHDIKLRFQPVLMPLLGSLASMGVNEERT